MKNYLDLLPYEILEYIYEINNKNIFDECLKHIIIHRTENAYLNAELRINRMYKKKYGIPILEQPNKSATSNNLHCIYRLCCDMLYSKNHLREKLEKNGVVVKKSWKKVDMIRKLMKL